MLTRKASPSFLVTPIGKKAVRQEECGKSRPWEIARLSQSAIEPLQPSPS